MAGHSKWANIKHKKAAQDKKRGKVFTKLLKEVAVAAKVGGGGDLDANPRLRFAVQKAKKENIPKDNIEKAIKKATGAGASDITEVTFEGYAISGVAVFIETATDNHTRTVANIRSYFNKHNGSLGKDGCLQFVFERKTVMSFPLGERDEDELTLELIDAGAEEVEAQEGLLMVEGPMEAFGSLNKKLEELGIEPEQAGLERVPTSYQEVSKDDFEKIMKFVDVVEDDDDVQQVYHNIEMTPELLG